MLAPLDPALPVAERSLAALARTRALGLHVLGHFAGVTGHSPEAGRSEMQLQPPHWSAGGVAGSPGEAALLVDLTLGTAIRSALGPGLRLSTISLTLEHLHRPAAGALTATGEVLHLEPERGEGQGRTDVLDADGRRVATASGWFVALPPPPGRPLPPVPWEGDAADVPDLALADLSAAEREAHRELLAAAERGSRTGESFARALTAAPDGASDHCEDQLAYTLATGPSLGNRVRHVQGGALYGAATSGAEAVAGPGWEVATGHVQFLRPVPAGSLDVRARILRRGRRVVFADVDLAAEGRTVLAGRFSLRPSDRTPVD